MTTITAVIGQVMDNPGEAGWIIALGPDLRTTLSMTPEEATAGDPQVGDLLVIRCPEILVHRREAGEVCQR